MEVKLNKIKSIILNPQNRIKIFVALGLVGILLIVGSEMKPAKNNDKSNTQIEYNQYISELEDKTQKIVSSIEGVGECKVMITLSTSEESVYAQNIDEKINDSSMSQKNEYVFNDKSNGDEPVLIKQYFPNIQGVVVVCSGGDKTIVQERVINCIKSLYNISASNISVSKIKG